MFTLSERQKNILQIVVGEYIKSAIPVSSNFLKSEYYLDCSSATIRLDLAELTDAGFLHKPYISGGRVPTDKGYRFFVDHLSVKRQHLFQEDKCLNDLLAGFQQVSDYLKLCHQIAKDLARLSSNLSIVYVDQPGFLWKEGWGEVVKSPEFSDINYFKHFTEFVSDFENGAWDIALPENQAMMVFIGREVPFKVKDFSMVVGRADLDSIEQGGKFMFAILGPKRMNFKKNIALVESLMEFLGSAGGEIDC